MNEQPSIRSAFRTRAVIDWIELSVTLQSGTQFRYVQSKLQSILELNTPPFVRPVDAGAGNVAKRFAVRLHDAHVATLHSLDCITAALSLSYPFAKPPEVTGIEIALDFKAKHDQNAIPAMVHRLQSSIEARGNPRQYDPDKAPTPKHGNRFLNPERPEPVSGLSLDPRLNLRIGNKGDPVQWQIYDKRTDNNRQPIAMEARRARAEFTLTANEFASRVLVPDLPPRFVTLEDLRAVKFETLASLLHFRQLKPIDEITEDPLFAATLARLGRLREQGILNYDLGLTGFYRDGRRPNHPGRKAMRKHSRHTFADAELNDIARRALKALTRRFA